MFLIQYNHAENRYVLRHAPIHIEDNPFLKVFYLIFIFILIVSWSYD